jgi:hypothetical protein
MLRMAKTALGLAVWPARDPAGELIGGYNLYAMVGNDPVGKWDLRGLEGFTSLFHGWSIGAIRQYGRAIVRCTDEKGCKKRMLFEKWCWGTNIGVNPSKGVIIKGMDRERCRHENYEGVFWEVSVDTPLRVVNLNLDISESEKGEFGAVVEAAPGVGVAVFPVNVARCVYTYLSDLRP